jgi:hypothetical protein
MARQSVSAFEPINDIGISSLEPLEAISFDIPTVIQLIIT